MIELIGNKRRQRLGIGAQQLRDSRVRHRHRLSSRRRDITPFRTHAKASRESVRRARKGAQERLRRALIGGRAPASLRRDRRRLWLDRPGRLPGLQRPLNQAEKS